VGASSAHADVHNVLLQVFDDGRLTDGKGRTVDSTNTIIIATSNVGSEVIQANLAESRRGRGKSYVQLRTEVMGALRSRSAPSGNDHVKWPHRDHLIWPHPDPSPDGQ
jgi:ATP-dependent Clp protease ATP-binding subunit ClpC